MAARKKGDLVLYSGDLFPTDVRKPPFVSLSETKNGFVLLGFSLSKTSQC